MTVAEAADNAGSLRRLFAPRKVAVVGASSDPKKVANRGIHYMTAHGFAGEIIGVNSGNAPSGLVPSVASIADLPEGVDVAVLAIPAEHIIDAVAACGARQIPFAVIFANGFADVGDVALQERLTKVARDGGVRIVGPNCLGVLDMTTRFAGTFSSLLAKGKLKPGRIGLVSQSGAVGNSVLLTFHATDVGISAWLATGNEVDIDALEGVRYMLERPDTDMVIAVLEAVKEAGLQLHELGRRSLELGKPVLVFKAGKSDASRRAAESHTGKIVGSHESWRQIVGDSGLLSVDSLEHLSDVALAIGVCGWRGAGSVAILCGSGGVGGIICDDLTLAGIALARLSERTVQALRKILPSGASTLNPVDPTTVTEDVYYGAADALLRDEAVSVLILAINSLARDYTSMGQRLLNLATLARQLRKSVAATYFSPFDKLPDEVERQLRAAGVLILPTSARLARSLGSMRRWQALVTPEGEAATQLSTAPIHAAAIANASVTAQSLLEMSDLLARYDIAGVPTAVVEGVAEALAQRRRPGEKIVLKLESSALAHKSDAGLVRIGLRHEAEIAAAIDDLRRLREIHGGVIVAQPQIENAVEVIVGGIQDPELGRLITVGLGGIFVELIGEMATILCPAERPDIIRLLARGRLGTMLAGYRGQPRRDVDALARVIAGASRLLADRPDIDEFELNPVMVGAEGQGAWVVDALATIPSQPAIKR